MNPGFAGIDNELYYMEKTLMLFGDAKTFVAGIVKELSSAGVAPGRKNRAADSFRKAVH